MGAEWIFLPLVGALIGWGTNRVAVRMLFRPRKEVRVPLLGWSIQGLLPRRHVELARLIGETVERDLLSADTVLDALKKGEYRAQIIHSVEDHLEARIDNLLPRFLPHGVQLAVINFVKDIVTKEIDGFIGRLDTTLSHRLKEELSVASIVEEKILGFNLDELERLITGVASPELRYIELMGAVLGGLIGIGQAAVVQLL